MENTIGAFFFKLKPSMDLVGSYSAQREADIWTEQAKRNQDFESATGFKGVYETNWRDKGEQSTQSATLK